MFGRADFVKCVADALQAKGYGPKRASAILDDYTWRISEYERDGVASNDAAQRAMVDTFQELKNRVTSKATSARKNLQVLGEGQKRLNQVLDALGTDAEVRTSGFFFDGKSHNGPGVALARALYSHVANDPRFKGTSFESQARIREGRYWALFDKVIDDFSKGAFGRQLGTAHFPNVVRELHGEATGDATAKLIAETYTKAQQLMVDDFRLVGGDIDKRKDFRMPQRQNPIRVIRAGMEAWVNDHLDWLDWNATRFPDGALIRPEDRERVLREVWGTLGTDGKTKIDPTIARGRGSSIGNAMDNHRFLVYKDADSWSAMHERYGDGTVFDVIQKHINSMSRRIALVDHFGRNPELMLEGLIAQGLKASADVAKAAKVDKGVFTKARREKGIRAVDDFTASVDRLKIMMADHLGKNTADANGLLAASVHATADVLNGVLLGGSLFANMASDFSQTLATRLARGTRITAGVGTYLKAMAPGGYRDAMKLGVQSGFITDELTGATYAAERWTGLASHGPAWARTVGDVALRLSTLNRHTNNARWVNQSETMGMMARDIETPFDKIVWKEMAEAYGIDEADWDRVRKSVTLQQRKGANFLQPIDILATTLSDKDKLFVKFASMVDSESRNAVPDATSEARAYLRGSMKPNTMPGALMHSFSMFKNYPVTFMQRFGRYGASLEKQSSRLGFVAALGLGTLATGALATQLNEIVRGREPMPMDTAAFWLKVGLNSGGLGIWGNYIVQGLNDERGHWATGLAGPLFGTTVDVTSAVLGDGYAFINSADPAQRFNGHLAQRLNELGKSYAPGSRVWWLRLVLEREIWDRFEEWADPKAASKRRMRAKRQQKSFGNTYFAPPGERLLTE